MPTIFRLAGPVMLIVGVSAGYLSTSGGLHAQNLPNPFGSANVADSVYAVKPAPFLTSRIPLWPNQPSKSTHWSIDDIRKSHQLLADADRHGKTLDPNRTLHDFPYWTRSHAMFVYHTPYRRVIQAEQHMGYAQFIVIMGGTGTAKAGGRLRQGKVLIENGQPVWGEVRGAIEGGETYQLKEGDWVSIPPNVPAEFRADADGGLTYMVMKINAMMYPWDLIR